MWGGGGGGHPRAFNHVLSKKKKNGARPEDKFSAMRGHVPTT